MLNQKVKTSYKIIKTPLKKVKTLIEEIKNGFNLYYINFKLSSHSFTPINCRIKIPVMRYKSLFAFSNSS